MNITLAFILYVAVFRLAIVISAIISIVLGYYLFCRGVWPEEKLEHGTDVETRVAGTRLTLKNAAPGTCFALFGVVIIGLMFARGAPELNLKGLGGVKAQTVRSDTDEEISWSDLTRKGIEYESQGNTEGAVSSYREAVNLIALPIGQLAWQYQRQGNLDEALQLSRLSVQLVPDKAEFIDTLAVILCKKGERAEALSILDKANKLQHEKLSKRLQKFKEGSCQ
jgi:tetratricopeptide (TPR) repeat protein